MEYEQVKDIASSSPPHYQGGEFRMYIGEAEEEIQEEGIVGSRGSSKDEDGKVEGVKVEGGRKSMRPRDLPT